MARKEYMVVDIVDILRRCQKGDGIRPIARATGMGRNTVKKHLHLAYQKGFTVTLGEKSPHLQVKTSATHNA